VASRPLSTLRRPQPIPGMTLGTLLEVLVRNGFRIDFPYVGRLAYLVAMGVFNSLYARCEKFFDGEEIQSVRIEHPPLFVLGHWRSGTTHLHNLLSCDPNFGFPNAYQASFPRHFIFTQVGGMIFDTLAPVKRPMDNVAFSSLVPHEDEFAIVASCGVSPYVRCLFPVTAYNGYTDLDLRALDERALERWKEAFLLFLKKLTLSEGKRIVLKSPPHTGRIGTLLEMFPEAQFVHIVRDPYRVYLSTKKLWKNSLSLAHLQAPGEELVEELILSWYTKLFALYERDKGLIPAGALHEMKYEDLELDPLGSLERLYEGLGLEGFDQARPHFATHLESVRNYEKNVYRLDAATRETVARRWRSTFETYGYPV